MNFFLVFFLFCLTKKNPKTQTENNLDQKNENEINKVGFWHWWYKHREKKFWRKIWIQCVCLCLTKHSNQNQKEKNATFFPIRRKIDIFFNQTCVLHNNVIFFVPFWPAFPFSKYFFLDSQDNLIYSVFFSIENINKFGYKQKKNFEIWYFFEKYRIKWPLHQIIAATTKNHYSDHHHHWKT